jgi:hypothetical protein
MDTPAPTQPKDKFVKIGRERFTPGAYTLDLSSVHDVPLTMNGQPSTFAEVYCKLRDSKVKDAGGFLDDTYATEDGEIRLDGEISQWPLRATIRELAALLKQGIEPHEVTWLYYGHDWSCDADESYSFFAVYGDKIVLESSNFSSEEPAVLKRRTDNEPIWQSHPYFDEAYEIYWYRKFYTETMSGQLMVLRPDEPILYHYAPPGTNDVERALQLITLVKAYRLLWLVIPLLVAVVFPALKYYMAVAAAVLGLNLLWTIWTTRKAGNS